MSYKLMETAIKKKFKEDNVAFERYIESKDKSLSNLIHWNTNEVDYFDLIISYPGYKSNKTKYGLVYDYRVSYCNVAVSHPSIIIDLYNKAYQHPEKFFRLKEILTDIAYNGISTDLLNYQDLANSMTLPPSQDLLEHINRFYYSINKGYLASTNNIWNFSFEELKHIISWIALQEDINYPMNRSSLQGRMMPFFRYLEALHAGYNKDENLLMQVIDRALQHRQPPLWENLIDYAEIKNLKTEAMNGR